VPRAIVVSRFVATGIVRRWNASYVATKLATICWYISLLQSCSSVPYHQTLNVCYRRPRNVAIHPIVSTVLATDPITSDLPRRMPPIISLCSPGRFSACDFVSGHLLPLTVCYAMYEHSCQTSTQPSRMFSWSSQVPLVSIATECSGSHAVRILWV
jgi:hypothetical protein